MIDQSDPPPLSFQKRPIRYRIIGGALWFDAASIFAAARIQPPDEPFSEFASEQYALHIFDGTSGAEMVAAVTPLGALTIAADAQEPNNYILSAWLRKHAIQLLTAPGGPAPEMPLTYLANGRCPLRPRRGDPNYGDWLGLSVAQNIGLNPTNARGFRKRLFVRPHHHTTNE